MPILKPYVRNSRMLIDGSYENNGNARYILHKDYAKSPELSIRAFEIILKDFIELTEYIEPSDINLPCYSFRTHELLTRICIEVEANLRAILIENDYITSRNFMDMDDYRKVEISHKLSQYIIKAPIWNGNKEIRKPFEK